MDYPIYVLARLRLLSSCCHRVLLYHGGRFPGGEAIDRFLCPQCGLSYSLAEALAPGKGTPAEEAGAAGAVSGAAAAAAESG